MRRDLADRGAGSGRGPGVESDEIRIECNGKDIRLPVREAHETSSIVAYREQATEEIRKRFGFGPEEIENADTFYQNAYKMKIHRAVPVSDCKVDVDFTDDPGQKEAWYYVRVAQRNGQMAWSSPIWVRAG